MPIRPARGFAAILILTASAAARLDGQDTTTVERTPPPAKPSPMLYITPFLSAGWSQHLGTPNAWKRTWGGYGSRVGDQFGSLVVRESVRRLVDHAVPWVDDRSPCLSHPVSPAREVIVRTGCAIARTSASFAPPGGCGTRRVTGLSGKALAVPHASAARRRAPASRRRLRPT